MKVRNLVLILGDQLCDEHPALEQADRNQDVVVMVEAMHEATHVVQHKHRLILFFSAMRHFAVRLQQSGWTVLYFQLAPERDELTAARMLARTARQHKVKAVQIMAPGDYRVRRELEQVGAEQSLPLQFLPDPRFYDHDAGLAEFAKGRKSVRLEHYYRHLRKQHDILMVEGKPESGRWNYDRDNREVMTPDLFEQVPDMPRFEPDAITREVIKLVDEIFSDNPGSACAFAQPVTAEHARQALEVFIDERLPSFGRYQDAMVVGQSDLFHSRLSASMNIGLLKPQTAVEAALAAHASGHAPLASVEGFVRQILGWREFVRGIYWSQMPDYANRNALDADLPVPTYLWSADTHMACVHDGVQHLKRSAYTHHIQRLMVLGQLCLLLGVDPYAVHEWHMGMYLDAIDWVSLPNVLGMSQFADDGLIASKPYCASGNYINKMSNYCTGCRYQPGRATGPHACPFTTLYWDFLARHQARFANNSRMRLQLANLERKSDEEVTQIRSKAQDMRHAADAL